MAASQSPQPSSRDSSCLQSETHESKAKLQEAGIDLLPVDIVCDMMQASLRDISAAGFASGAIVGMWSRARRAKLGARPCVGPTARTRSEVQHTPRGLPGLTLAQAGQV